MNPSILRLLVATILMFTLLLSPAYAGSNQDINQTAMVIAPKPDSKIGIYAKPDNQQSRIGYAQAGNQVTVIEQVGSNTGATWNHVRFTESSQAPQEGWIQSNYLSFQLSDSQNQAYTPKDNPSQGQTQGQGQGYTSSQGGYQGNTSNQKSYGQGQSNQSGSSGLKKTVANIKQKLANVFK
jgi:hypothetical protein